jgi:alanine racemase
MTSSPRNRVEINLKVLQENCRAIQKRIGSDTKILAVVKSDGYGHGMVPSAQALSEVGVKAFGVADLQEAVVLREAGVRGDIVVLLGVREIESEEVIHFGLQPVVFDVSQLKSLASFAAREEVQVGVHLKVDTGMGRLGVMPAELEQYTAIIRQEKGLFLAGLMSHFPCADSAELSSTKEQNELFGKLSAQITGLDETFPVHIANSAAAMRSPDLHWDMVRPGLSLYGCYPSEECRDLVDLKPVMSFKTEIIQVKDVPAGFGVSYGHTFVTGRPSKLAMLPVGYNDGFLRSLSNRAHVLVHGKRAPQLGRVCMNVTVVDVTDIPGVQVGDEVVLMGNQGEKDITADDIADWMETINYEVLCLFGNLNQRVYLES